MKQDDTFPLLTAILSDQVGPVDLTTAASVKFIMKKDPEGTPLITGTCVVVTPQTGNDVGKVTYDWIPADTQTVGEYLVEFQVTWSAGNIETYPNDGYKTLAIIPDLGD